MNSPSPMLRLVLWTVAAVYLGCGAVAVAGSWLASDVLPGATQALATGVIVPVALLWLSIAGTLVTMGVANRSTARTAALVRRKTRISLPVDLRFAPQSFVRR